VFCRRFELLIYLPINQLAIGCVDPPLPANVKLLSRSENLLKISCSQIEHVFPDTAISEKTITCDGEAWNQSLAECVGELDGLD
jgi:hypothetical protein